MTEQEGSGEVVPESVHYWIDHEKMQLRHRCSSAYGKDGPFKLNKTTYGAICKHTTPLITKLHCAAVVGGVDYDKVVVMRLPLPWPVDDVTVYDQSTRFLAPFRVDKGGIWVSDTEYVLGGAQKVVESMMLRMVRQPWETRVRRNWSERKG